MSEDKKNETKSGKGDKAPEEVKKTQIPHVREAGGDAAKIREHARHAWGQIEAGHYAIENLRQEDMGNGRTRITFERVETNLGAEAHPHGL